MFALRLLVGFMVALLAGLCFLAPQGRLFTAALLAGIFYVFAAFRGRRRQPADAHLPADPTRLALESELDHFLRTAPDAPEHEDLGLWRVTQEK